MAKIGTKPIKKATEGAFKKNPETASNDVVAAQSDRGYTVSKKSSIKPGAQEDTQDTKEGKAYEEKDSEALESPKVNQEEEDFLKKYKKLIEINKETMASYHKIEAEKQFGKERVEELLK